MRAKSKRIPRERELAEAIEQGYASLDSVRSVALQGLLRVRQAKTRSLERQLEKAHASRDRTAVRQYAALTEDANRKISALRRDATLARTRVPSRKERSAVVYGYVWEQRESGLAPVEGARVVAFEGSDDELGKQFDETRTDERGYFEITIPAHGKAENDESDEASRSRRAKRPATARIAVVESARERPSKTISVPIVAQSVLFRELFLGTGPSGIRHSARRETDET